MARSISQAPARTIRLVAIPAEHGGWGFVLEPVLLGLLVAPTQAGLWLSLAALAVFLIRHPLELAITDWRKGKRYPRTAWAERFAFSYVAVALLAGLVALVTAPAPFVIPILLAAPLALVQFVYDMRKQGRDLLPELAGAAAMGAVAPTLALAAGWPLAPSLALWAIVAVRSVSSIVYVRARLRMERGEKIDRAPSWVSHSFALVLVAALALIGVAPWLAVGAMLVLLARALWGLSPFHKPVRAQIVGFQEIGFGLMLVALTALGYILKV